MEGGGGGGGGGCSVWNDVGLEGERERVYLGWYLWRICLTTVKTREPANWVLCCPGIFSGFSVAAAYCGFLVGLRGGTHRG